MARARLLFLSCALKRLPKPISLAHVPCTWRGIYWPTAMDCMPCWARSRCLNLRPWGPGRDPSSTFLLHGPGLDRPLPEGGPGRASCLVSQKGDPGSGGHKGTPSHRERPGVSIGPLLCVTLPFPGTIVGAGPACLWIMRELSGDTRAPERTHAGGKTVSLSATARNRSLPTTRLS